MRRFGLSRRAQDHRAYPTRDAAVIKASVSLLAVAAFFPLGGDITNPRSPNRYAKLLVA